MLIPLNESKDLYPTSLIKLWKFYFLSDRAILPKVKFEKIALNIRKSRVYIAKKPCKGMGCPRFLVMQKLEWASQNYLAECLIRVEVRGV